MDTKPKIAIVFYTTYLHTYNLAEAIREGAEKNGNCEVKLYQVSETLSQEELEKIKAPAKPEFPSITPNILKEYDGFLFGYSSRYGTLPAQLKEFFDSCGGLWEDGKLQGKMAGAFCSTPDQHSGHETSIMSLITTLTHFGIIFVPLGYVTSHLNEDAEVIGGSPWGASVIAGKDELRQPNEKELVIARIQGENFAKALSRYHGIAESEVKPGDIMKNDASLSVDAAASVQAAPRSAPKETLVSEENKDAAKNEAQASLPVPVTEVASKDSPQTTDAMKKPKSIELIRGEISGASGGQSIKNVGSKESGPTNKTTSGLKKFFKRLSTRPKAGDSNPSQ